MKTESERKVDPLQSLLDDFSNGFIELRRLKHEAALRKQIRVRDALVEALKSVDEMFSNPGKTNKRTIVEQVRAALKLAGKEGE